MKTEDQMKVQALCDMHCQSISAWLTSWMVPPGFILVVCDGLRRDIEEFAVTGLSGLDDPVSRVCHGHYREHEISQALQYIVLNDCTHAMEVHRSHSEFAQSAS